MVKKVKAVALKKELEKKTNRERGQSYFNILSSRSTLLYFFANSPLSSRLFILAISYALADTENRCVVTGEVFKPRAIGAKRRVRLKPVR